MVTIFEAQLAPVVLSAGKLYIYLNNKMNRKKPKRHYTVIFFLSSKNWESFSFILYRIKCPALITKPTSKPQYVMGFFFKSMSTWSLTCCFFNYNGKRNFLLMTWGVNNVIVTRVGLLSISLILATDERFMRPNHHLETKQLYW